MFSKMMTNPCSKILKYVLDDKFGMLVENSSEDRTKGDVWPVSWTNQKGIINRIMTIQNFFFFSFNRHVQSTNPTKDYKNEKNN